MKTVEITTTEEVNRLKIRHDEDSGNPREWHNIGIFLSKSLPDDRNLEFLDRPKNAVDAEHAWEVINNTEVCGSVVEHADHIANELGDVHVIPVYKYEHSGVSVFIEENGTMCRFDTGVTGFYIVHKADMIAEDITLDRAKEMIANELSTYTQWVNGDVYRYELIDKGGEYEDSCGGFYELDDMKSHLPKEWEKEDLNDYVIY